jgi:23S rRNA (uracil1939-C5)-methyltransferase
MDTKRITIEKWVYGGHGLARDEGRVVLTPFVLPGEIAAVEQVDRLHSRLVRIDRASEIRIEPDCPYFGDCGGCHYQHAPYEYQVQQKVAIVREVMRRIGKFDAPAEIDVIAGPAWNYRNRVQLHHSRGRIGFLRAGSHELCAITHCPISSPRINEVIGDLTRRGLPAHVRTVEVFTNEIDVIVGGKPTDIEYRAAGQTYRVSAGSFFQVNRFLIDALVDVTVAGAGSAVDLYAGVGLFALPLAKRCNRVIAVEGSASAVADLKFNARRAGLEIEVHHANVDEWIGTLDAAPALVVADPPRAGLGKTVTRHMVRLRPQRIHIVACDPATLARDLAVLLSNDYRIDRFVVADLFPQTYHMETVVHLSAS